MMTRYAVQLLSHHTIPVLVMMSLVDFIIEFGDMVQ